MTRIRHRAAGSQLLLNVSELADRVVKLYTDDTPMITKFAALAALDDALVRRCNHLCDVYLEAAAAQNDTNSNNYCLLRLMHGLELAGKDYRKAKQAIDDSRNLSDD